MILCNVADPPTLWRLRFPNSLEVTATAVHNQTKQKLYLKNAVFRIRIRVLKVRIRPFINLCDLNDGFDKVLEVPDQKGQC